MDPGVEKVVSLPSPLLFLLLVILQLELPLLLDRYPLLLKEHGLHYLAKPHSLQCKVVLRPVELELLPLHDPHP